MELFHQSTRKVSIRKLGRRRSRKENKTVPAITNVDHPKDAPIVSEQMVPDFLECKEQYLPSKPTNRKMPPRWLQKHEAALQEALRNVKHGKVVRSLSSEPPDAMDVHTKLKNPHKSPMTPASSEAHTGANRGIQSLRDSVVSIIPNEFHEVVYTERLPSSSERETYQCHYIPEFKQWRILLFPPLFPSGRGEVTVLSTWLSKTVTKYLATVQEHQERQQSCGEEQPHRFIRHDHVLETLEALYRLAHHEICRQEKLHCFERGLLLENVHDVMFNLNNNRREILKSKFDEELALLREAVEKLKLEPIHSLEKVETTVAALQAVVRDTEKNYKSVVRDVFSDVEHSCPALNMEERLSELEKENAALKHELRMLKQGRG